MIQENLNIVRATVPSNVTLIAVSKTKPVADLQEAYETYLELYSEDIEKGEILLEKKKNLIIKASSKYALEDALGK